MTILKVGIGYVSHSVGVLSEGIHSCLDLISATLSYFTVRVAIKPADQEHPFGHGKIETLSSLFEAILLMIAAFFIIYEGTQQVFDPKPIQYQNMSILIMFISAVASVFAYRHNALVAKQTESSALHVNALHFLADAMTSAGILIGLVLLQITHWPLIDPLMAFVVAIYILIISIPQIKNALLELSDFQLPHAEIQMVQSILNNWKSGVIEAHDLRTRKSGATRHMDFHLVVCRHLTVENSHTVCDELESKIKQNLAGASITIHVEPCAHATPQCQTTCTKYEIGHKKFE